MPLDIRSQVVTALDNINKNPELYTPPKPTTSLETRINDLKELILVNIENTFLH